MGPPGRLRWFNIVVELGDVQTATPEPRASLVVFAAPPVLKQGHRVCLHFPHPCVRRPPLYHLPASTLSLGHKQTQRKHIIDVAGSAFSFVFPQAFAFGKFPLEKRSTARKKPLCQKVAWKNKKINSFWLKWEEQEDLVGWGLIGWNGRYKSVRPNDSLRLLHESDDASVAKIRWERLWWEPTREEEALGAQLIRLCYKEKSPRGTNSRAHRHICMIRNTSVSYSTDFD